MVQKKPTFVFRGDAEKSREWVNRDLDSISPSYTRSYGFTVDYGRGAEVWDVDGNRYIDFAAGIAVLATGFSHPKVVEAVKNQVEKYMHIGGTDFFSPQPVLLAEKLQQIIPIHHADGPQDKLVYFGNSGTEAVEAALKLARYGGRDQLIAFYGAFHGRSMGSLSLTASKNKQRSGYPYIPGGVTHVPYPALDDPDAIDAIKFIKKYVFKKVNPLDVAGIIVEPIQGEGGYRLPESSFLPRLRDLCDEYGILLISDEIQAGMGRTGRWCAMENWDVKPDIVCLAKGLGSGMPIGAIVAHRNIMGLWSPGTHASTFGGNPVSCVAATATIDVIESENLLESVQNLGQYTIDRLQKFMNNHPSVSRVGGTGFMVGIDFAAKDGSPIPSFRDAIVDECYKHGLLTLGCGESGIRFAPPLVLNKELLDEGLDIFERSISSMEELSWS
ncbi:acetyl ornithine aminotransferase family protein [Anaerolineales bacterium]